MDSDRKSILESLLFLVGEPVKITKLARVLELDEAQISESLTDLKNDLENCRRGLQLVIHNKEAQLVTSKNNARIIEKFVKSDFEEDLSQAALETLAVIAYRGPVSRAKIEDLRGVNCSFILRSLAIRGLIERKENPEDRRSHLYQVSFDFLRHLGLSCLRDLPEFEKFRTNHETRNMKHESQ